MAKLGAHNKNVENNLRVYHIPKYPCEIQEPYLQLVDFLTHLKGVNAHVKDIYGPTRRLAELILCKNRKDVLRAGILNVINTIRYTKNIAEDAQIRIRIYNIAGQLVDDLKYDARGGVTNEVEWQIDSVASGLYIYVVEATRASGDKVKREGRLVILK